MLLDPKVPENFAMSLIPSERRDGVKSMLIKISEKLSLWFRGQLLLSVIMGTFYLIALLIIGVPYALTIAIIAMLLEFIPIIGPIVSGTIAALIALTVSPLAAVIVIAVYLLGQWLENSIITPTIMKKVTGLSPIIVIVAILIGDRLLGPAGAILAVPISATISVAISEWPTIRKTLKTDD
jgi:predicted PurR-regulated permease PerM